MKLLLTGCLLALIFSGCNEEKKPVTQATDSSKEPVATVQQTTNNETKVSTQENTTKIDEVVDGQKLFASCSSCHGQKAEKSALNKSQIISTWDKQKIKNALIGYKNGTYGGAMKDIMKGQMANKSDAQIEALADYISKLK